MKVFISADMEGVGGVTSAAHQDAEGQRYEQACRWMLQEVNAAIEGVIAAGAKTIVVKDAHDTGLNIDPSELHPAAELISGWGPLASMADGLDETFNALLLIGYHARVHTSGGTLAHTWSRHVLDLRLNGHPLGEAGWVSAFAGHFGVPLALVTGDDKLVAQLSEELPEGFHTVVTKTGLARSAARMRPLGVVREEIRRAAAASLAMPESLPVFRPSTPLEVTVRFRNWEGLDACAAVPGVSRLEIDQFAFTAADMLEAQKYFMTLHRLARQ